MKRANPEKTQLLAYEMQSPVEARGSKTVGSNSVSAELPAHRTLGIPIVVFMIIGKVVGGGLIWFPKALSEAGWFGFVIMVLSMAMSAFTGVLLARSWLTLREWFPNKYRDEINRQPYAAIGYETFGVVGRRATTILIGLYSFGFTVTLYLVAADNIRLLVDLLEVETPLCAWIPVVVVLSMPMMWLGTPKDMFAVGVALACTTFLGAMAIAIGSLLDIGAYAEVSTVQADFASVAGSLGLIMGAFGGQFVIPTLQHDMKCPQDVQIAVVLGYLGIGVTYAVIGVPSLLVYGNIYSVFGIDNVLALLTSQPIQIVVTVCLTVHLVVGVVIMNNPLFQDLENSLNIPYEVTWKRVLLRSLYAALTLLVGLIVPSFPAFLSVVGGVLVALVNVVLPSVLYLKLRSLRPPEGAKPEGLLRWYQVFVILFVIVLAIMAALSSSVTGVYNLTVGNRNMTLPCFLAFE